MKSCKTPLLLTFALIVSLPLMSHASACSNSTIRGTYAFTIHGTIFVPNGPTLVIDGIAKETFDGKGNETQVDAVATNGMLTPGWRPGHGQLFREPGLHWNSDYCGLGHARPALAVYRRPGRKHYSPSGDRSGGRSHG